MNRILLITQKLIAIVIVLNLLIVNVSAYEANDQVCYINDSNVYTGKIIPFDTADAAFSDKIEYVSLDNIQFEQEITILGDSICVDLVLFLDSMELKLTYEGSVYKSFRHTAEKPVYIGVFNKSDNDDSLAVTENRESEFEIIYFEISNATSPYNLNQELRDDLSITMYLRNREGTIFDLGRKISSPIVLEEVNNQAPSDKDINWFLDYFKGVYNEVQNNSPRSSMSSTWNGNIHTLQYQIAGYEHKFSARPYVDFSYGDVPTAGVTPFSMSLKIIESHYYRETGTTTWIENSDNEYSRCFEIDKVQLTWTAGGNTEIKYVAPHLNIPNQGGGSFNFIGLTAAVTGVSSQTASLSSILAVADSILNLSSGTSTSFTNTANGGALSNTSAYTIKFPENYYIDESSDGLDNTQAERFEYVAFMATSNSNLSENYRTYAVADFVFVLSWEDITGQSGSQEYEEFVSLGYYNNYS